MTQGYDDARGPWRPCSDASRERDDPIAGTGGFGSRWLLVEIDRSWGPHAFLDSGLGDVGRAIARRAEQAGMRPVAIRRFGRRADERRRSSGVTWAIADARPGHESMAWGWAQAHEDLLDLSLDGSSGTTSSEPVALVCTHARHDRCCAVRGRPVAQALSAAAPETTWECSHLGGDRFAATMILLPHGLYYGRVPPERAHEIVDAYARGLVVPRWFRGRSSLTLVEQAAVAAARERLGDERIDAYSVMSSQRADDGTWRVVLLHDDGQVDVVLEEALSEPMLSTCGASALSPVREWRTVRIDVRGA